MIPHLDNNALPQCLGSDSNQLPSDYMAWNVPLCHCTPQEVLAFMYIIYIMVINSMNPDIGTLVTLETWGWHTTSIIHNWYNAVYRKLSKGAKQAKQTILKMKTINQITSTQSQKAECYNSKLSTTTITATTSRVCKNNSQLPTSNNAHQDCTKDAHLLRLKN